MNVSHSCNPVNNFFVNLVAYNFQQKISITIISRYELMDLTFADS